jgi:hypothetical protein
LSKKRVLTWTDSNHLPWQLMLVMDVDRRMTSSGLPVRIGGKVMGSCKSTKTRWRAINDGPLPQSRDRQYLLKVNYRHDRVVRANMPRDKTHLLPIRGHVHPILPPGRPRKLKSAVTILVLCLFAASLSRIIFPGPVPAQQLTCAHYSTVPNFFAQSLPSTNSSTFNSVPPQLLSLVTLA